MKILAIAQMNMFDGCKGIEAVEILENVQDLNRFMFDHTDNVLSIEHEFYVLPNDTLYEFVEYDDVVDAFVAENQSMSLETTKLILSRVPNQY